MGIFLCVPDELPGGCQCGNLCRQILWEISTSGFDAPASYTNGTLATQEQILLGHAGIAMVCCGQPVGVQLQDVLTTHLSFGFGHDSDLPSYDFLAVCNRRAGAAVLMFMFSVPGPDARTVA